MVDFRGPDGLLGGPGRPPLPALRGGGGARCSAAHQALLRPHALPRAGDGRTARPPRLRGGLCTGQQ
eukprot:9217317-Lingulodinium_polyedra.AAC.1